MQIKQIFISGASVLPCCFEEVKMCVSLICFCAVTSESVWSWTRMTKSVSATTSRWKSSASSWMRQKSSFSRTGQYFCGTGALSLLNHDPLRTSNMYLFLIINLTIISFYIHLGIRKPLISMNQWWRRSLMSHTTPTSPKRGSASVLSRWERETTLVCTFKALELDL